MNSIEDKCKKRCSAHRSKKDYSWGNVRVKRSPRCRWLHKRVSEVDKKISIATVYRTVKLFEEAGILEKHEFKGGKARYDSLQTNIMIT